MNIMEPARLYLEEPVIGIGIHFNSVVLSSGYSNFYIHRFFLKYSCSQPPKIELVDWGHSLGNVCMPVCFNPLVKHNVYLIELCNIVSYTLEELQSWKELVFVLSEFKTGVVKYAKITDIGKKTFSPLADNVCTY